MTPQTNRSDLMQGGAYMVQILIEASGDDLEALDLLRQLLIVAREQQKKQSMSWSTLMGELSEEVLGAAQVRRLIAQNPLIQD